MDFIARIFWNREEHRVRSLWRLLVQIIAWFVLLFVGQVAVGISVGAVAVATQAVTPQQLSDPQAVQALVMASPLLLMLFEAVSLVAVLLTVFVAGRLLDRRLLADFGFHFSRRWWADFGFGLLLGAFLMGAIFLAELAAGWVTVTGTFVTRQPGASFVLAVLPPLLTFVMVAVGEELFSRGYQLTNLAEGLNWPGIGPRGAILAATLISSAIFGLLHATNPNASVASTFNIFLAGIFLALGYVLTGELAISIGLHLTWNLFQGNMFGFPVSGTDFRSATVVAVQQGGPDLWTGGAFGPEAGLVGIAAMLLGSLLIVLWVRSRYSHAVLHTALAEAPLRVESGVTQPPTQVVDIEVQQPC